MKLEEEHRNLQPSFARLYYWYVTVNRISLIIISIANLITWVIMTVFFPPELQSLTVQILSWPVLHDLVHFSFDLVKQPAPWLFLRHKSQSILWVPFTRVAWSPLSMKSHIHINTHHLAKDPQTLTIGSQLSKVKDKMT